MGGIGAIVFTLSILGMISIVWAIGVTIIVGIFSPLFFHRQIGKTLEQCKKMSEDALLEEINKTLFARKISLQGNALGDDFGTNLIAKDVELVKIDVNEEAEKLSQKLEDLL